MPFYVEFAENHVVEGKIKAVLPSMSFYESQEIRLQGVPPVHGRRPQCRSPQCKSPPSNVSILGECQ